VQEELLVLEPLHEPKGLQQALAIQLVLEQLLERLGLSMLAL